MHVNISCFFLLFVIYIKKLVTPNALPYNVVGHTFQESSESSASPLPAEWIEFSSKQTEGNDPSPSVDAVVTLTN